MPFILSQIYAKHSITVWHNIMDTQYLDRRVDWDLHWQTLKDKWDGDLIPGRQGCESGSRITGSGSDLWEKKPDPNPTWKENNYWSFFSTLTDENCWNNEKFRLFLLFSMIKIWIQRESLGQDTNITLLRKRIRWKYSIRIHTPFGDYALTYS